MASHRSTSSSSRRGAQREASWLRHFWLVLGFLVLAGIGFSYLQARDYDERDDDTFISVPVKTKVGDFRMVQGKISLLVDAHQEKGLLRRQQQLETVVAAALADVYGQAMRPSLARVHDYLQTAINASLPRKLRVRDVLIQDLVVGLG